MARPLRIQWAGCWYHITSRGNERRPIYLDDADRFEFLNWLSEMTSRFQARLHVYALMVNHYHLLLQTLEANLSKAMQWLNSGYSQWFNARHRRCGHLLQGRFKGIVVEPEAWGLELSRYIHLNPVRVERFHLDKKSRGRNQRGIGEDDLQWRERIDYLRNYPWRSYQAYVGLAKPPSWLESASVLGWLGGEQGWQSRA
ncbi:MAG: transposase [Terriglobia bacterium]